MWAVSGAIVDFVSKPLEEEKEYPLYLISIGACFIFARVSTFILEILMFKIKMLGLNVIRMSIGVLFLLCMEGAVIFFTFHMDREFKDWGWIVLITFYADLIIYETVIGISQVIIS